MDSHSQQRTQIAVGGREGRSNEFANQQLMKIRAAENVHCGSFTLISQENASNAYAATGPSLWIAHDAEVARLCTGGDGNAGAGHRREHRDVQRGVPRIAAPAS